MSEENWLKEYEIAHDKSQQLEDRIWKTFAIVGIAGFTPLVSLTVIDPTSSDRAALPLLGVVLVLVTFIWWGMARRWWEIQRTTYLRMHHIEEDHGMFLNRYVDSQDRLTDHLGDSGLSDDRVAKVQYDPKFCAGGVQKSMRWFLVVLPSAWLILSILRLIGTDCCSIESFVVASAVVVLTGEIVWAGCLLREAQPGKCPPVE